MDKHLEKLLAEARGREPMSADEIEAQKRSFVRAEAGFGSDSDEAAYAAAVARGDKVEIERLDKEAEARMEAVDRFLDGH